MDIKEKELEELIKKNTPKRVIENVHTNLFNDYINVTWTCPSCYAILTPSGNYCSICGQKFGKV